MSKVYFVRLGDHVKIGWTTNLAGRLASYRTAHSHPELLLEFDGDRALEKYLHEQFAASRVVRELFRIRGKVGSFIEFANGPGLAEAMHFLEATNPAVAERERAYRRREIVEMRRRRKDSFSALCAGAVAERKSLRGW